MGGVAVVDLVEVVKRIGLDAEVNKSLKQERESLNQEYQKLQKSLSEKYDQKKKEFGEKPTEEQIFRSTPAARLSGLRATSRAKSWAAC